MSDILMRFRAKYEAQEETEKARKGVGDLEKEIKKLAVSAASMYLGWEAFKTVIVGSVKEFAENERASARLGQALRGVGQYSEENVAALQDQAQALARQTGIQDNAITGIQALSATYGILPSEMNAVTHATYDLAAATEKDAASALRAIIKATEGETDALRRMYPSLDTTGIKAGDLSSVLAALAQTKGAAAAQGNTLSGSFDRLGVATDEFKETLGGLLTGGGGAGGKALMQTFIDMVGTATSLVKTWGAGMSWAGAQVGAFAGLLGGLADGTIKFTGAGEALAEMLAEANEEFRKGLQAAWADEAEAAATAVDKHTAAERGRKGAINASKKAAEEAKRQREKEDEDWAKWEKESIAEEERAAKKKEEMLNRIAIDQEEEERRVEERRGQERKLVAEQAARDDLEIKKRHAAQLANIALDLGQAFGRAIGEGLRKGDPKEAFKGLLRDLIRMVTTTIAGLLTAEATAYFVSQNYIQGALATAGAVAITASGEMLAAAVEQFDQGGVVTSGPRTRAGGVVVEAHAGEAIFDARTTKRMVDDYRRGGGGTTVVNVQAVDALTFADMMGGRGASGLRRLGVSGRGRLGQDMRRAFGLRG